MTLHYLITLIILPIGTSGYKEIQHIKYASEYILKLKIHQQVVAGILILKKHSYINNFVHYILKIFPVTNDREDHKDSSIGATSWG